MALESDVAELKIKMAIVLDFLGEISDKIDIIIKVLGRRESQRRSNNSLNSSSEKELISLNITERSSLTKRKIFDVSTEASISSSKSLIHHDFENEETKRYREKRKRKENTFDLLASRKIIPEYRDTYL